MKTIKVNENNHMSELPPLTDKRKMPHYVNVSVLIKFLQKTSVFTLIIISFSIKSYVLDVY